MLRWTKPAIALAAVAAIALALRAALPYAVERYVNRVLAGLEGYSGQVDDVDLAIWRGRYSLHDLLIEKRQGDIPMPFLRAPRIELSIEWGALFHGALVAEVHALSPQFVFVDGESKRDSQSGLGTDWGEKLESLAPFRFNKVTVRNGRMEFRNFKSEPEVELYVSEIDVKAVNLTNVRDRASDVFGTVAISGLVMGQTPLSATARLDPVADPPEIELDAAIENLPLPLLNSLFKAYANVDAEAGTISVYSEIATADGRFKGYVQPLLKGADFARGDEKDSIFRKAWEGVVDLVAELFENQPRDQFASRIPLSGQLDAVDVEVVPAIFNVLRNAFIQALAAGISGTIGLEDVDNPFENEGQAPENAARPETN